MTKVMLSERALTVVNKQATSALRRIVLSRLEASMSGFMSPIERWPDANYEPRTLDYSWERYPEGYAIVAPLHGFKEHEVHVDLSRDHVIVLLSQDYSAASPMRKEYYCEAAIPADADGSKAYVEVEGGRVVILLNRKPGLLKTLRSSLKRIMP
ncbi:MAG: Hsp20/alpha crystallin family protein [bacterium]|nr:Hsp20/alpha crystallin family protein [bacterium]